MANNIFSNIGYSHVITESTKVIIDDKSMSFEEELTQDIDLCICESIADNISDIKINKDSDPKKIADIIKRNTEAAQKAMEHSTKTSFRVDLASKAIQAITLCITGINMYIGLKTNYMFSALVNYLISLASFFIITKASDYTNRKLTITPGEYDDGYIVAVEAYCCLHKLRETAKNSDMSSNEKDRTISEIERQMTTLERDIIQTQKNRVDFMKMKDITGKSYGAPGSASRLSDVKGVNRRVDNLSKKYDIEIKQFKLK